VSFSSPDDSPSAAASPSAAGYAKATM
jgi:hypothetical protein